jgi:hypothetical protein
MNARWLKLFRQLDRAPEIFRCARASAHWASLSLAFTGLRPLRYTYLVLFRDGDQIRLDGLFDHTTFWSTFFRPAYPVEPNDAVIMDAGANIGTFTPYAARTAPAAHILDIEGGEYPSILSSPPNVLRRIRRICMEYHPMYADQLCSKGPLFAHLARADMVCTFDRPDSGGYGVASFQLQADS